MVDETEITLGTIIREEDLLIKKPPVLCLQIPAKELERALRCLLYAKNVKLIQLNTAAFAYVPILKQLQEIKEISVENELLHWKSGTTLRIPNYNLSPELMRVLDKLKIDPSHDLRNALRLSCPTKLDNAQALCFLSALQGPDDGRRSAPYRSRRRISQSSSSGDMLHDRTQRLHCGLDGR